MTGDQFVQVVAIVVGAVVTLGTLWLQLRMSAMEKKVDELRATIASLHALTLDTRQQQK